MRVIVLVCVSVLEAEDTPLHIIKYTVANAIMLPLAVAPRGHHDRFQGGLSVWRGESRLGLLDRSVMIFLFLFSWIPIILLVLPDGKSKNGKGWKLHDA